MDVLDELQKQLSTNTSVVLSAPPGAGKSTLVPLFLNDADWLAGKKIIMLEPRRLAAKTVALRMADLLGEKIGETVGYRIRFETKVSAQTKIEVVTEGILTRMLQSDNSLEGVGLVIFDEFHERSIHADLALALCREAQQILRNDLRILIMSATLNLANLKDLLQAPVVESLGKQYPIDIIYTDNDSRVSRDSPRQMIAEMTAYAIAKALNDHDGDVLAFLPGEGEIRKCEEILRGMGIGLSRGMSRPAPAVTDQRSVASRRNPDAIAHTLEIHPLYGQLPPNKQMAAIFPSKHGARKVVIATSIAETSLTIEGVRIVVDSGYGRVSRFDQKSGLSRLETIQISKDSADQRAGRAGRLSAGVCYRLWSKPMHAKLQVHRTPEILEADLAPLVLDMAQWGVADITSLTWLNTPPQHAIQQATELLEELSALEKGKITAHGKKMHELPCHPRIAHMLLQAATAAAGDGRDRRIALAADIAALLEERDPLPRDSGIDINLRSEGLRRLRASSSSSEGGGLDSSTAKRWLRPSKPAHGESKLPSIRKAGEGGGGGKFSRIIKIAESYRNLFNAEENNDAVDPFETGLLLVYAYPERIAFARPGNNAQFQLSNGKLAMAGHKDDLAHEPWLALAHLDARDGMGKIFMASPLDPRDLVPLLKEKEVISWNSKKGELIAHVETRIGSIVLKSTPLKNPSLELIQQAIVAAIKKEGEHILNWNDDVVQLQHRVLSLIAWNKDDSWPNWSTQNLLQTCETWLRPYLINIKKENDLEALNLYDILYHSLDFDKQNLLNQLAPTHLEVPSGSNIKLNYTANASDPILAVRLQEVFGLADTPTVNNGKTKVLMHLLSPGYKPVQITADLRSFWEDAYFEVKKEMKQKYKKHAWPEDPWNHPAIRGTKKQNGLR